MLKANKITGTMVMEHVWSQGEPAMAIVCVCASTYLPLFRDCGTRTAKVSSPFPNSTRPHHQLCRHQDGLHDGCGGVPKRVRWSDIGGLPQDRRNSTMFV